MHSLDLTIVIAYLALITFVGVRLGGRVKSAQDFFLAGRSLTWWVIGLSIIGTNIGANSYVGAAGNAFTVGIAQANFEWIGAIPAMILAALVFIPLYWKAGGIFNPRIPRPTLQPSGPRNRRCYHQYCWYICHRGCTLGPCIDAAILPGLADMGRHHGHRHRGRALQHCWWPCRCCIHRFSSSLYYVHRRSGDCRLGHRRNGRIYRFCNYPDCRKSQSFTDIS